DGVIGKVFELAQELSEELRPLADNLLQIAGHLAREREQHVGVLAKHVSKSEDGFFGGRRLFAALDLAEIGRLNVQPRRDLADGKGIVRLPELLTSLTDVIAERAHACSIYYTVHEGKSRRRLPMAATRAWQP